MITWNILWRFGIFYDHLVHFAFIWYIFSGFGFMYQETSGNPDHHGFAVLAVFKRLNQHGANPIKARLTASEQAL
jgi:hypothetical protein